MTRRGLDTAAIALAGIACLLSLAGCSALPPASAATPVQLRAQWIGSCFPPAAGRPAAPGPVTAPTADPSLELTAFRDAARWREHLAAIGSAPGSPLASWRVDFAGGESVLRIDAGQRPSPGHRLVLGEPGAQLRGDRLEVRAAVTPPPPGSFHAQMVVLPCAYLHVSATNYRWIGFAAD